MINSGVALALLLGVSGANAAGLGKLTINSSLGQVLNAEIDLVSVQSGELELLTARVAPPEAFRDARIEYTSSLRLLRFSVEKRASGQPYIKVTSSAPVNEPFVDALIEVTWPQGRIQREYPILLDPPGYSQSRTAAPTVAAAPPPSAPAPAATSAPAAASVTPAPAPSATAGSPSARSEMPATSSGLATEASADTYGPVKKGDTLRKIAEEVKPSSVSLDQMLVALYRENKAAFVNNNMNRLKAGQILKVPNADEVSAVPAKEATTEIRTHVADWKSYRGQLGSGVASVPARPESTSAASGRVASAAVTPPPSPAAENKDVLKLSKSDAGKGATATGKGGNQNRLNAMQEDLVAKDNALRESQSRVADLEKQIRDMQRLLDLKGGAPGKADTKVAAAPAPAPAKAPEPAKVEPVKPAEPAKLAVAPTPAPAPEPAKVEPARTAEPPKVAEAPKTEAPKVAEAPKPAPPKAVAKKPPPPPEKSFVDELTDNPVYLLGGLGLLALGGGAFLFMRRRRNQAYEAGPSSANMSAFPSDLKVDTTTGKSGGGLVDTGNSSFLTDFDKTGPGTIDTDEVDPVAEAEVYIAYGRDAQAEEILKEAMARDRSRPEIPLKLLEIYHARKSGTAFETVAKELHAQVGDSHPMWQKAAAMGAQIDPTNALYGGATSDAAATIAPAAAPAPRPNLDFDIANTSSTGAGQSTDFDLDKPGEEPAAPALDFDIEPSAASASEPAAEDKPANFDFDLSGLDFPSSTPAAADTASAPSPDLADLSLDLPSDAGSEGVGTKLELAKAYLEIGDKDGAREILQEVAREGSAAQKDEAQRLISSL
ncbi:MAG: FimV/HubP family polar landmark protein [Usitatibacter sp.]